MSYIRYLVSVAASAALCAIAPSAGAATLFAAPTGATTGSESMSACPESAPCSLTDAVAAAVTGDSVILAPGSYPRIAGTDSLNIASISLGGRVGAQKPVLTFAGTPGVGALELDSATLHDIVVRGSLSESDSALIWANSGAQLDRVQVEAGTATVNGNLVATNGVQLSSAGKTSSIRNSIIHAAGQGAIAVLARDWRDGTSPYRLIGDTIVADGHGGTAIRLIADGASDESATQEEFDLLLTADNVIARGGPGGVDINTTVARTCDRRCTARIELDHVNAQTTQRDGVGATLIETATQHDAPIFVAPSKGDWRQAASSPTIDAGSAGVMLDSFDFAGGPRVTQDIPDIGADEFDGPMPHTIAAEPAGLSGVKVRGSLLAGGSPASYAFEYGPTTSYGSISATETVSPADSVTGVESILTGLAPRTTYHLRLVAWQNARRYVGNDLEVETAPAPAPALAGEPTSDPPALITVSGETLTPLGPMIADLRLTRNGHARVSTSAPSAVMLTVDRVIHLHRYGCTSHPAARRRRRCTAVRRLRNITVTTSRGTTAVPLGLQSLPVGRYRLTAATLPAPKATQIRRLGFVVRIVAGRRVSRRV